MFKNIFLWPIYASRLREWYLVSLIPGSTATLVAFHYAGILFSAAFVFLGCSRRRLIFSFLTTCFLAVSLLSSAYAQIQPECVIKWVGLAATVAAIGPLIGGSFAQTFRLKCWNIAVASFVITTLLSLLWAFLPLPRFEYGLFTGVTFQPKTLSMNSSLAFAVFAARYGGVASLRSNTLLLLCLIVTVATGSRTSVFACLIVAVVAFGLHRRLKKIFALMLFIGLAYLSSPSGLAGLGETETAQYYQNKGIEDTRSHLWELRWDEIESSPYLGYGIGMAKIILVDPTPQEMGAGYAYLSKEGTVTIEPGSAWLASFSMTGVLGGLLNIFIFLQAILISVQLRSKLDFLNKLFGAELLCTGIVYGVHMFEGGFTLSFGNPDCLIYWLWVGVATWSLPYSLSLSPGKYWNWWSIRGAER